MIVKCPACEAEYDCTPGKYLCECGVKFRVAADGGTSIVGGDSDRTIPPLTALDDTVKTGAGAFDPEKTVPGIRIRGVRGELQLGDVVLGRYELLEKLGSGVMGVVFKCRDRVSRVEYAVKMVPPELARSADAMEEVRENFQLVYNLNHPNIAGVKFLERDEYGAYFLIMEYASGENLAQWIKRKWKDGGPELGEVTDIVKQIAAALDYAHGQKILHRDVKPANVMIDEAGNVKVLDFGLASKVRNTMTALSVNPANTSGTPNYLSPEQFKGKYPSPASDQYALGVLTYQMLAGHLPFDSDDFSVLRAAVNNEKPDDIDGIPDAINACLQKALAKEPNKRYSNCTAFAASLESNAMECISLVAQNDVPVDITSEKTSCNGIGRGKILVVIVIVATLVSAVGILSIYFAVRGAKNDGYTKADTPHATDTPQKTLKAAVPTKVDKARIAEDTKRGFQFNNDGTFLLRAPNSITEYVIPYGVRVIHKRAFEGCTYLQSLTIPDSVTFIDVAAFKDCVSLQSLTIPDGVTSLKAFTFYGCSSLRSIKIPSSVTEIDDNAFSKCTSLTMLKIPDGVKEISSSIFSGCTSLTSLSIPDGVTKIGSNAFDGCTSLRHLRIPSSVTKIDTDAFEDCTSLTNLTIPSGVTSNLYRIGITHDRLVTLLDKDIFYIDSRGAIINRKTHALNGVPKDFSGLYVIPTEVTAIGENAFSECKDLTEITIPGSVTTIRDSAFLGCIALKNVVIPDSVTVIENGAFFACKNLSGITIPHSVKEIGDMAFCNCQNLASVTLLPGVTKIGWNAFSGCLKLTSVTIPGSVKVMGDSAFDCPNLTSVTICQGVETIGLPFIRCPKLTSVKIPDSVKEINLYAFSGCPCEAQLKRDYRKLFKFKQPDWLSK